MSVCPLLKILFIYSVCLSRWVLVCLSVTQKVINLCWAFVFCSDLAYWSFCNRCPTEEGRLQHIFGKTKRLWIASIRQKGRFYVCLSLMNDEHAFFSMFRTFLDGSDRVLVYEKGPMIISSVSAFKFCDVDRVLVYKLIYLCPSYSLNRQDTFVHCRSWIKWFCCVGFKPGISYVLFNFHWLSFLLLIFNIQWYSKLI